MLGSELCLPMYIQSNYILSKPNSVLVGEIFKISIVKLRKEIIIGYN